jgi:hypothetical protein
MRKDCVALRATVVLWTSLPYIFGQTALTTAQIAERVSRSVVIIQGKTDSGDVVGSGFIASSDGRIVTNLHVVRDMKSATLQLSNRETYKLVSVLAIDEMRDLAVIEVSAHNLPALEMGESDRSNVGEPVVIVGSPLGLEGTVTAGILSSIRTISDGLTVLQTDAAVNPGSSGGPLVNGRGQVIGVISFKLRSAEGLTFAIPINYVRSLLTTTTVPMTLEQMRTRLVEPTTSAAQAESRPSLNETLGWLRDNIPLGIIHKRYRDTIFSTSALKVWKLDSCTVTVGDEITSTYSNRPDKTMLVSEHTIPLGSIKYGKVVAHDNTTNGICGLLPDSWQSNTPSAFSGGDRWEYCVRLESESKVIRSRLYGDQFQDQVTLIYGVSLSFADESLARRVLAAFLHAADLCRAKEPF